MEGKLDDSAQGRVRASSRHKVHYKAGSVIVAVSSNTFSVFQSSKNRNGPCRLSYIFKELSILVVGSDF